MSSVILTNHKSSDFGRVAVVMGGQSAEREVSLKTGNAVLEALLEMKVDAFKIEPDGNLVERLKIQNVDRVFIALHGPGGEDGTIQGALELAGIPYTGSGVMASAIAMNKAKSKWIWKALNIATPDFQLLSNKEQDDGSWRKTIGYPLAVKPATEGSSIGIHKVRDDQQLTDGIASAREFSNSILVEQWVTGEEYTVTILAGKTLPAIRLNTDNEFFDFDAKYQDSDTKYSCPCGLTEQQEKILAELSLAAFQSLDCSGWGRVDLMRDAKGDFWVLEVNTVPGLTDHSLVPMAAAATGMTYPQLVLEILATSL
ncbi:MAG: D-alanine--D-alanine ligase [Pseudomonadales bacterium]|nr:D-alanine--D-alanine ligase [Pseudomonadales bacterium]